MPRRKLSTNTSAAIITLILYLAYEALFSPETVKMMNDSDSTTCESDSTCLKLAIKLFESSINESFNPCENFYEFACQGWITARVAKLKETNTNSATRTSDLTKANALRITTLLDSIPISSTGLEGKLRQFYTSCTKNTRWAAVQNYEESRRTSPVNDDQGRNVWGRFVDWLYDCIAYFVPDNYKKEFCSGVVRNKFPIIVAKLFLEIPNNVEIISSAVITSNHVLQTVKESVQTAPWNGLHAPNQIDTRIGFILDTIVNPTFVSDLYSSLTLNSDNDYLENLKQVDVFNQALESDSSQNLTLLAAKETPIAHATYRLLSDFVLISPGEVQMPRFHPGFLDVFKFAKLGVTVAHELGHAVMTYFNGVMLANQTQIFIHRDPSQSTKDFFKEKCSCVTEQYSEYEIRLSNKEVIRINATFTLEDNVADIIGMEMAFKSWVENDANKSHQKISDLSRFSNEQIFFIAWAQEWCQAFKDDEAEAIVLTDQVKTDDHCPSSIRVLGTLRNFQEFSDAFHCPIGARYNPREKCQFF